MDFVSIFLLTVAFASLVIYFLLPSSSTSGGLSSSARTEDDGPQGGRALGTRNEHRQREGDNNRVVAVVRGNDNNNANDDDAGDAEEDEYLEAERLRVGMLRRNQRAQQRRADLEARAGEETNAERELRDKRRAERDAWKQAEQQTLEQLRAERQQRQQAELNSWRGLIKVEEAGGLGDVEVQRREAQRAASARQTERELVVTRAVRDHNGPVMALEALAETCVMPVNELVETLEALVARQEVLGVLDERGKFVRLTEDCLEDISNFIRDNGRTSHAQLKRYCCEAVTASG